MKRGVFLLAVLLMTGCATQSLSQLGPTGHASDRTDLSPIAVNDGWKYDLRPKTQEIVKKEIATPDTARFDDMVRYEAYYDRIRNVTWVSVFGNVSSKSDYGTDHRNGYYVTWEQNGKVTEDFLPPWKLSNVELLDHPY